MTPGILHSPFILTQKVKKIGLLFEGRCHPPRHCRFVQGTILIFHSNFWVIFLCCCFYFPATKCFHRFVICFWICGLFTVLFFFFFLLENRSFVLNMFSIWLLSFGSRWFFSPYTNILKYFIYGFWILHLTCIKHLFYVFKYLSIYELLFCKMWCRIEILFFSYSWLTSALSQCHLLNNSSFPCCFKMPSWGAWVA